MSPRWAEVFPGQVSPGQFVNLHLHGQVADLSQQILLAGNTVPPHPGMRARGLSVLRDEIIHPLLDFGNGEIMGGATVYVWDGWDLVYERCERQPGTLDYERKYTWGLDASAMRGGPVVHAAR